MLKDITGGVKQNKTLYAVLSFIVIIIIIVVIYKVYKGVKGAAGTIGESLSNDAIAVETGIPMPRVVYIRNTANDLWNNSVTGITYFTWLRVYKANDFVDAINAMTSAKEVALLNECFKEKAGENLKAVIGTMASNTKDKIKAEWLTILNA